MALETYTPTGMVHNTSVDFAARTITQPIHIVQGDQSLPVIAVEMLLDGQPYAVPAGESVNIRMNKLDGTFVYNPALGCNADRTVAYIEITPQMTTNAGTFSPEIEVMANGGLAGSSKIKMIVDETAIQDGMIESSTEAKALVAYADAAKVSAEAAKTSEESAKASQEAAETAAENAQTSAEAAEASNTAAKESETNAAASATAAADSATASKASEDAAAATLVDVTTAKNAAANSATEAADSETLARSYARGDTATRDGEESDNAKYYMEQAQKAALGTLDTEMSYTSTNAVENRAITEYVNGRGNALSYDEETSKLKLLSGDNTLSEVTIESGSASLQLVVTFDEEFKGAAYTITGGGESYSGTVPDSLQVIQKVKSYNTTYTVKSMANSQEYTSTVATGQYAGEYATVLNTFTATIQVTVTASAAAASGATVKAKSGANEYTATTNASGVAEVKVHNTGEYSITATYGDYNEGTGDSVTISTDGESVSSSVALFGAVLKVTADISSAAATDASKVTVSDGTHNFEKTITATSTFSFTIYNAGTYKINMTNGTDIAAEVSVDVLENGTEYPANVSYLKIVTWADGTDEEVAAMVAAADKGAIKLSDYWGVGDERKVKLSAMAATGVGEIQMQEVTMVLMNVGGVTLQNGKECNFVVGQKNSLATYGNMNSSATNSGSWGNCARRKWCNEVYFKALPEYFQNMLKMMETKTPLAEGAGAEVQTVEDMIALPASAQVWKDDATAAASRSDGYSSCAREDFNIGLEQWEWFKTPANRVKKLGDTGNAFTWWERSPSSYPSLVGQCFCYVYPDGTAGTSGAEGLNGFAPFGCI